MQLTKENIAALRNQLVAVRERGKEYFDEADPEKVVETAWPFEESWEIKPAKTLQKCEVLRQTIKELSVDIAAAARASPLLADADMVSVRSGRGMGPVKRISHIEARPHKVLSFCW